MFKEMIVAFLSLTLLPNELFCTSIVMKVTKEHIVLAADTRGTRPNDSPIDDVCKIASLGRVAFASSGLASYTPTSPGDLLPRWDALDDARIVFRLHGDLQGMADGWVSRVKNFYEVFYAHRPERVKEMAGLSADGILISGLFAGWHDGHAELIEAAVILADGTITSLSHSVPESSTLYTTNAVTRELIAGQSERAKVVTKKWDAKSPTIPQHVRDWRMAEFYVDATSAYDPSVGDKGADVIEVTSSGTVWRQNKACRR